MHAPKNFQISNDKLRGQQHPWHNINNGLYTTPTNDKNARSYHQHLGSWTILLFLPFCNTIKEKNKNKIKVIIRQWNIELAMVLGSCHGNYFQISASLTHIFPFEVFFFIFIYIEKT
jgi:hypothetical protein